MPRGSAMPRLPLDPYMLILIRMMMRCLRNSGLDRRHMAAEAALAMRDVMSREEEPPFVIKDPRYMMESTNTRPLLPCCIPTSSRSEVNASFDRCFFVDRFPGLSEASYLSMTLSGSLFKTFPTFCCRYVFQCVIPIA